MCLVDTPQSNTPRRTNPSLPFPQHSSSGTLAGRWWLRGVLFSVFCMVYTTFCAKENLIFSFPEDAKKGPVGERGGRWLATGVHRVSCTHPPFPPNTGSRLGRNKRYLTKIIHIKLRTQQTTGDRTSFRALFHNIFSCFHSSSTLLCEPIFIAAQLHHSHPYIHIPTAITTTP
ncbi:hypothetical protein DL89DRAFT_162370 [Linderina pennispora]|uniref:Uncharacterized protein n=1 Tax=Linderina pennispora TaxID=61395 RepID=A0A1Y1W849_9FUNG|nr:uncharacterized protein DL89DRAFT_162370 [Linderina pennispora]ORX69518.1 hypothetical protein DL89DRAFT_162370 [Linderina pennispora]